jgi:quercetin 2,3-dioxygenase
MYREVIRKIENIEQDEGLGARVRRSIGGSEVRNFDPFLLLDEFNVKAPAGFPDHPHRGFETVTYMISGHMKHEDFKRHKGIIGPGDLQWMTAGRGILHCEMPHGNEPAIGLQLWVNLAKQDKMIESQYQELLSKDIPVISKNGVTVKIIAGESMGTKSPVYTRTPVTYLDFKLQPNAQFIQEINPQWNSFIFVLFGEGYFGPESKEVHSKAHHTLLLNQGGNLVRFVNKGKELLHFVLIAGKPLNEPVVQHGPFVMNTQEEIKQTFDDYRKCKNGFENAATWNSQV